MFYLALILLSKAYFINACSNIIVQRGASEDNCNIISYNADSGSLYGTLYHYPRATYAAGTMRQIYDWDSGLYLGEIEEAAVTYNVVGNINEYGVIIGETTYGGLEDLQTQSAAKIDYGSLIWVTLQRSQSAREAIKTMASLMATYGYASEGESFSIADQNEAWIMELIGKGEYELGAVWVARRLPEGAVSGHANQARITQFPLNDPDNCIYSDDVISFARDRGYYTGSDEEFSFSDVYDPVTFSGARFCDARVWSFFSSVMGAEWSSQYEDYALGYNLTNRMPLWVFPSVKQSAKSVLEHMRNHYEDSVLDMSGTEFSDVGAMAFNAPLRWRPLTWADSTGATYLNERAIATQQTGWNFVAFSRHDAPRELSGVMWFGVDDSSTTVHFPVYGSATRISPAFAGQGPQDGVVPPMMTFDMTKAFPVFNLVANWAYSRWSSIYPELKAKILTLEDSYAAALLVTDAQAIELINNGNIDSAIELVTQFSANTSERLVSEWSSYFGYLFMRFRDGYLISEDPADPACGCTVNNNAYSTSWYDRIVANTGDHLRVLGDDESRRKFPSKSKLTLRSLM